MFKIVGSGIQNANPSAVLYNASGTLPTSTKCLLLAYTEREVFLRCLCKYSVSNFKAETEDTLSGGKEEKGRGICCKFYISVREIGFFSMRLCMTEGFCCYVLLYLRIRKDFLV